MIISLLGRSALTSLLPLFSTTPAASRRYGNSTKPKETLNDSSMIISLLGRSALTSLLPLFSTTPAPSRRYGNSVTICQGSFEHLRTSYIKNTEQHLMPLDLEQAFRTVHDFIPLMLKMKGLGGKK